VQPDACFDSEIRIVTMLMKWLNSSIVHPEKLSFFMPTFKEKSL